MAWTDYAAIGAVATVLAFPWLDKEPEFVRFTACGYTEAQPDDLVTGSVLYVQAPSIDALMIRPEAIEGVAHIKTRPGSLECVVLRIGGNIRPVVANDWIRRKWQESR